MVELNLPHRRGLLCSKRFAKLAELPDGEWTTDPTVMMNHLDNEGFWWGVSHLEAWVCPTVKMGPVNNSARYDKKGRPIIYREHRLGTPVAESLCRAYLKAKYDLPPAFMVEASYSESLQ